MSDTLNDSSAQDAAERRRASARLPDRGATHDEIKLPQSMRARLVAHWTSGVDDVGAWTPTDEIGPVPVKIFESVHRAFATDKWLEACGRPDPALRAILAPLRRKGVGWSQRDYAATYAALVERDARRNLASGEKADPVASLSPWQKTPQWRTTLRERQKKLAAALNLARRNVVAGGSSMDVSYLYAMMAETSRELQLIESSTRSAEPPDPIVVQAAAETYMAKRARDQVLMVEKLIALAETSSNASPAEKRDAKNLLSQINKHGIAFGAMALPLKSVRPQLADAVERIIAPLGRSKESAGSRDAGTDSAARA